MVDISHTLSYTTSSQGKYYLHFTYEETEAQELNHSPKDASQQQTQDLKSYLIVSMTTCLFVVIYELILGTVGLPVVMYGCESWTIKKDKHRRIDAFECGAGEDS